LELQNKELSQSHTEIAQRFTEKSPVNSAHYSKMNPLRGQGAWSTVEAELVQSLNSIS